MCKDMLIGCGCKGVRTSMGVNEVRALAHQLHHMFSPSLLLFQLLQLSLHRCSLCRMFGFLVFHLFVDPFLVVVCGGGHGCFYGAKFL